MKAIFLGKPLHWLIVGVVVALGAYVGAERLHVREFNAFVAALFALSVLVVLLVVRTTAPGERVTRDELEPDDDL